MYESNLSGERFKAYLMEPPMMRRIGIHSDLLVYVIVVGIGRQIYLVTRKLHTHFLRLQRRKYHSRWLDVVQEMAKN